MDCEVTGIGFDNDSPACFQRDLDHIEPGLIPTESSEAVVNVRSRSRIPYPLSLRVLHGLRRPCASQEPAI